MVWDHGDLSLNYASVSLVLISVPSLFLNNVNGQTSIMSLLLLQGSLIRQKQRNSR